MSLRYVLNATEDDLNKVKTIFLEKYKTKIENGSYHPKDLERIHKDNEWIKAFWKNGLEEHNRAADLCDEVLDWRKKFGANDLLTPGKLPFNPEMLKLGAIFKRNKDKNGLPILHYRVKTHKKGRFPHEDVCKLVAYFLEKEYKFNIDNPIVLQFDMTDVGYSNVDIEMAKFNTYCLKSYYAGLIEYIVVFNMPFVFQAVWAVIKALLPAKAVELVKFVDKKSIKEYIDEDQLFIHLGGTDSFEYNPDDPDLYVQLENAQLQLK